MSTFKVLLLLQKESTNYWLPIIHSSGFRADEGHWLSLSYSKKESESNDILIYFVEFSNLYDSGTRSFNITQSSLSHENVKISQRKERGFIMASRTRQKWPSPADGAFSELILFQQVIALIETYHSTGGGVIID